MSKAWRHRLAVRTEPSHGFNRGSIPLGATKLSSPSLSSPLGILVAGDNHLLVRGVKPDREMARYLVRRWTIPSVEDLLGRSEPMPEQWKITTKEFREDIEWAVVLEGYGEPSAAVTQLLAEVAARGVVVERA